MSDFSDDPRLTAFALGELDGAERAEVEALLARDEGARKAVDEIRATANLVAAELGNAGGAALTSAHREAIAAKAGHPLPARPVLRLQTWHWVTAAASVAAGIGVVALVHDGGAPKAAPAERDMAAVRDGTVRIREERAEETLAAVPLPEVIDRGAIPKLVPESRNEPIELDEVFFGSSGGGAGHNGGGSGGESVTTTVTGTRPADVKSLDFTVEHNAPSGATGGTAVGVGKLGHFGEGKPSSYVARRAGGGGRGGGGLVPGGKAFQPVEPKRHAVPQPLPDPADAGGPQTPGGAGGPTTGGPGAEEGEKLRRLESLGYIGGGDRDGTTATYDHIDDNPFRLVKDAPLSTFGIDVDTASYSNVRRFLMSGQLPPPGAVRIEEMVNYFPYDYAPPSDGRPFAVRVDVAGCPWRTDHRLVRVGIKGKAVATAERPAANLVFLLDVSGSMQPQNRLPLVLQSMKLLVGQLEARDRVAIVVYAGESGLALPSTSCEDKGKILAALDALHAGGSTNGASGIQLAYDVAAQNRIDGGVNRVILATDGDFNVGVTDQSSLVRLVQEKAKAGTFLSVLGVGDDNYKDSTMEMLADRGNGNYSYIDTLSEGRKVLVAQTNGTLVTIAKDVKIQVEFNPAQVGSYRLIGYENRVLAAEDFRDDKKDAGEIGAGHTVTAIYEVVPPGASATESVGVEPLKYQQPPAPPAGTSRELLTVKLRWKEPNADVSTGAEFPVVDDGLSYSAASPDFKFAASVAAFGMVLRGSPYRGNVSLAAILELATEGAANDPGGWRAEFVGLVKRATELGAK